MTGNHYARLKNAAFFMVSIQFISTLSICFLGLPIGAMPWDIVLIVHHGFYREVAFASAVVSLLCISVHCFLKGGLYRIAASYLFIVISAIILVLYVSVLWVFFRLEVPLLSPLKALTMLLQMTQDSLFWETWKRALAFLSTVILGLFIHALIEEIRARKNPLGRAKFATGLSIYTAGFLTQQPESLIIGKKYGVPLWSNGFEHVLVFAPTGSGKTRSIAIPNLFHYPYSVVCNDVKLTLFQTTSGYRTQVLGHQCFCWAPAHRERRTHRYNPLSAISTDKLERMTDIQRIAHILMPDGKNAENLIWQQASRKLFKVLVLYLLDTPERPTTFGEINRLIKQASFDDWLAAQLETTEHLDPDFYRNGYSYLNNHEKTRGSILETFSGYFELFDDPFIDAATSVSDFDLRTLRKEKITIYIGFTDDDMERLAPLLTLFWQQLISAMIQKLPDPKEEPYPLLCLIDEFSSLGRIERLRRALKLLREYRVRCILMLQYIAQTYERYSHDEARAFTNIKTKVAFSAEDLQDAEYISKLLGQRTVKTRTYSINQQQGYAQSQSIAYQSVPLMRPEDIMRLSSRKALIMRTGHLPVKAGQWIWYRENFMKKQVRSAIEIPILVIHDNIF